MTAAFARESIPKPSSIIGSARRKRQLAARGDNASAGLLSGKVARKNAVPVQDVV
jgi:hypothetical protein